MATINLPSCATYGGNTGKPGCSFDPKTIQGAILVDESFSIDSTEATSLLATLQAAVLATGKNRIYPIFKFGEVQDGSTEVKVIEHGYGDKEFGEEGQYDWTFKVIGGGGLCLQKKLRSFNGDKSKKVVFWDKSNNLIGTLNDSKVYGITMGDFYAAPFKVADGSNPAIYTVRFLLPDVTELNDDGKIGFIPAGFNIGQNVKGNLDVVLTEVATAVGTITVSAKTACDQANLYDTYADELADPDAWVLTKAGVAVTITGVTKDTTNEAWVLAFSDSGSLVTSMASATALAALTIGGGTASGYESDSITSTVPAA